MRSIVWKPGYAPLTLRAWGKNPPWADEGVSEGEMEPIAEWIKETGCGKRTSFDTVRFRSETEMSMFLLRWGNNISI